MADTPNSIKFLEHRSGDFFISFNIISKAEFNAAFHNLNPNVIFNLYDGKLIARKFVWII